MKRAAQGHGIDKRLLTGRSSGLDLIYGGRALPGLGSGNVPPEFAQFGLRWEAANERQAMLEHALRIIGPLLRGETVTVAGGRFQPHGAVLTPPPMQQPHVPIRVGGGGERTTLRFAARYADASNLGAVFRADGVLAPDTVVRKLAVLDRHLADAGRPANAVLRSGLLAAFLSTNPGAARAKQARLAPEMAGLLQQLPFIETVDEAVGRARAMVAAGMRYLIFIVIPGDEETLRLLAEQVVPAVA